MDRSHPDYIGTNARFINALDAAIMRDTNLTAESKTKALTSLARVISQKLQPFDGEKLVKAISPAARVETTAQEIGAIAAHYEIKALKATSANARAYHDHMSHLIRHAAYTLTEFSCAEIETATQSRIYDAFGDNATHDEALARRLAQRLISTQPVKALPMKEQVSLRTSFLNMFPKKDAEAPLKQVPVKKDVEAGQDEASSTAENRPFLAKQLDMLKIFQSACVEKPPETKEGAKGEQDVEGDEVKAMSAEERAAEKNRRATYRGFKYNIQLLLDKCLPSHRTQLHDIGFSLAKASALFEMTPKEFDWKMQDFVKILRGHSLLLPPDFSEKAARGDYPEINAEAVSRSNGFATQLNRISSAYAAHDSRVVQLRPLSEHPSAKQAAAAAPEMPRTNRPRRESRPTKGARSSPSPLQSQDLFSAVWRALEKDCINLSLNNPPRPLQTGIQPADILMLAQKEFQALMISMRLYAQGTAIKKNIDMFAKRTTELEKYYVAYHRAVSKLSPEPPFANNQADPNAMLAEGIKGTDSAGSPETPKTRITEGTPVAGKIAGASLASEDALRPKKGQGHG
ncbi:MAG: hypothetical protein K2Q12_04450 [Rickettsiales bacterium]|nr:hypothetical protein [Rickettsiales bacterium]